MPKPTSVSPDGPSHWAWWTLAFALLLGAWMRWIWIDDMEWKHDEAWSFRMSQEAGRTRPWPWVGMPTSLGFPNPGLSAWVFVAIGRVATTPTRMAHVIVLLNVIGLIGFVAAVCIGLPSREREPWLWGLALQAVSPFAIRMSRKIWAQSVLTPLLLLLWISHRYRSARSGAFAWGLLSALIGQVHLSGWFVATGLAVGTLIFEQRGALPRSRYWHWWILGTLLGLTMAIPWVRPFLNTVPSVVPSFDAVTFEGRILAILYSLFTTASSALPSAILGVGGNLMSFLTGPVWDGVPLHAYWTLAFFVVMIFVARVAAWLVDAIAGLVRRRTRRAAARCDAAAPNGDTSSSGVPVRARHEHTLTGFYLWSTVAIPIAIMFLVIKVYFYSYYFVVCPFLFVLVAVFMLPRRGLLFGLVVAEALMSLIFLAYIHQTGGSTAMEYGSTYDRQGRPSSGG